MEKNKPFFLLQEWAYYGEENKMESPNNVMLRDYYVIVLVLGIMTFSSAIFVVMSLSRL